jgi:DNA-binding NarL/FixJ family response regulator
MPKPEPNDHSINTSHNDPQTVFTEREKRILQLMWEEKSNKEIADELFLGIRSIEKIRQVMKEKTGVKSTIGLMKYALRNRLLDIHHLITDIGDRQFLASSQRSVW